MAVTDRLAELLADFELATNQSGISRTTAGKPLLLTLTHLRNNAPNDAEAMKAKCPLPGSPCRP
jgi:hypothetical protein